MNTAKLIGLLLISFIATGSVVYQLRNRKPKAPAVVTSASGAASLPAPAISAPAPQTASAPAAETAPVSGTTLEPAARPVNLPQSGWGRNPFLTTEEIDRMNAPPPANVAETPVQRPPVEAALPDYALTGIVTGRQGSFAIVDGRTLQPGDRIGPEIVKEIKERGVVLDRDGQLRELRLKSLEETAVAAAPKKEANKP